MSRKKKKRERIFLKSASSIVYCCFCVAAWKLWGYYNNYHGGRKEYEQLRQCVKEKKGF